MKKKLSFVIFLASLLISLNFCDTQNGETTTSRDEECCKNATNQQIVVQFTSNVVEHEYIVQFKNYYKQDSRIKYIKSALDNSEVNVTESSFKVI